MAPRHHKLRIVLLWGTMLFFSLSCENEVKKVQELARNERIPMEIQKDFELIYSDSTYSRMELRAPLAKSYPQLEIPQREFPEGLEVIFLDSKGQEDSRLRADYAIQLINKDLWEARGDVVVVNKLGEQLNTEKLFWDNRKEIIYSDEFVKMTTESEVIMGEGFRADQNFTEYEIDKVSGIINIKEEKEDA